MKNYHLNDEGNVGICRARLRCPFGDEGVHFETADEARLHFEQLMTREHNATKHTVWLEVLDQAELELTEEFGSVAAADILRCLNHLYEQYDVEWGRTRAVFLRPDSVIKIPLNGEGMIASSREVAACEAHEANDENIPMAKSTFIEFAPNVVGVLAERVEPVNLDRKHRPDWVDFIDCGQVGYTREGKLVAYDL